MDIKKILFKTTEIDVEKALPDGVIYCTKEGKILWVSDKAAEIFETSKVDLLTSHIADFIENAINMISSAITLNKSVITKFKDKEIYFDMTVKEITEGYVLDFRDAVVSKRIDEDEQFKVVNKDKNLFLLKLANDFKSPLQSIVGFSQAMTDGLGGSMSLQQEKYIRIIKKNSTELMYMFEKLLGLSKTESDLQTPENRIFDITNLAFSVMKYNEQLNKDKDIRWNLNIDDGLKKTICSDENYVKYIMQNIFEVVSKSVEMGEISMNLSIADEETVKSKNMSSECLLISVTSSSMLLTENDLENIFEPYAIIDSTNKKNVLRAIILATVKNYVSILNGAIWVESQILKSTTFNVLLPVNKG